MNAPTTRTSSPGTGPPTSYPPARLALRPPTFPAGPVCGGWWPRTDDLVVELTALLDVFDTTHGRVTRIASHRGSWATDPHTLPVTDHTVLATWYTSGLDPYTIRLFSHRSRRWDLFVVPPGSEAGAAARLMSAAADPALRLTGSALMATEDPAA